MIKLKTYGSSSKGNCHLLELNGTTLLLDCGKYTDELKEDIKKVDGILITHKHSDHCKAVKDIKNYYKGKYYSNKETLAILPVIDEYKEEVRDSNPFNINNLVIVPFELVHDVKCYGYLIKDIISGYKVVYITDTGAIDYLSFKDVDCFLIESNCDEELLTYEDYHEVRVYETHLSMQQTLNFLEKNVNYNTKYCILCHISSNTEDYKKHETYILNNLTDKNIKVIALDPHLKNANEIILKEDLLIGFD